MLPTTEESSAFQDGLKAKALVIKQTRYPIISFKYEIIVLEGDKMA